MVDFEFTPEQRAVRDTAREFATAAIEPRAREAEESREWPRDVWEKAVAADLVGVTIPEAYGGAGMGAVESAIVNEEFARADAGMAAALGTDFGAAMIAEYGTEAQKEWILSGITSGDVISGLANTEPGHGSDAASIETSAERVPADDDLTSPAVTDGEAADEAYVIDGTKTFITHGTIADVVLTTCRTGEA